MHWQFTPYLAPILLAMVVGLFLAAHAWSRRSAAGALSLMGLTLGTSCWLAGYALELMAVEIPTKLFWAKAQYVGIALVPLMWLTFSLHFTERSRWLSRGGILLASVIPLVTLVLVWTNDHHQWVWRSWSLKEESQVPALELEHGPGFWVYWFYSQTALALGAASIISMQLTTSQVYRGQSIWLLLGVLAPWIGNGIYILKLGPLSNLDLTPFAFTFAGAAFAWSLFRHRLLDIIPVAQRAVMEGMSDGVIVLDPQHRVVDLNPAAARILDRPANRLVGQPFDSGVASWASRISQADTRAESPLEILHASGGTQRYFDLRISPLQDRHGVLSGRLAVLRDVTERKQSEVELARARDDALEASRLSTELLSKVSHELRTPLSIILGFSEMLHVGAYGPLTRDQLDVLNEILGATHNLSELVNELLEQAQLDAGKARLDLSQFRLGELLDGPLTRLQNLAQAKGLDLTTRVDDNLPEFVVGDRNRLEQILINLVGNAIKYTSMGSVQVGFLRPGPGHWALQVHDTGMGVPPEAQSYIFEAFRQVDGSTTRQYGGVGLGLSIVKQFTGLMGGRIELESAPGKGSTFTVTFPIQTSQHN